MKKYAILCAMLILLSSVANAEGIIRDYYLRNREYAVMKEKVNILPNTLRLSINCGEYGKLRADVIPDAGLAEHLSWRVVKNSGAIEIYPAGASCTVFGATSGEETVEIFLDGRESVNVEVVVAEPQKVMLRSFELEEEEKKEPRFGESAIRWLRRGLLTFGFSALCVCLLLARRKWRKE